VQAATLLTIMKTPTAAAALGVPYWRLSQLIRDRRITPPHKDTSGDYVWLPEDLERARRALGARRRKEADDAATPR
jgi:hypothetical protein